MSAARDALARGAELFARGEFRAAHELWEEEWRAAPAGAQRDQLRALSQAAAACLHAERGNQRGARTLARKALALLGPDANVDRRAVEGLDLAPIRARIQDLEQRESS